MTVKDCDCDYQWNGAFKIGGCKISTPAPRGYACRCSYKGAWTCGGETKYCVDSSHADCRNPGYNYQSCLQGQGDCDGYGNGYGAAYYELGVTVYD